MPLSRSFKTTIKARAEHDAAYRAGILQEGVESLLKGDFEAAKSAIRVYINAIVGFDALAKRTGTPSKSLMRMFGPRGNPSARNLSTVLQHIQCNSGVSLSVFSATAQILFLICSYLSARLSTHWQESGPT